MLLSMILGGSIVFCAACGSDDADSVNNGMHHHDAGGDAAYQLDESRQRLTENESYFVSYTPSPDPIPFNELFELQIDVWESDAKQTRISDADVSVEVEMPAHGHGMNTDPAVTAQSDGSYLVEGMKFHMESNSAAERWEIAVTVDQSGVSDKAVFDVMCCGE